MKLITSQRIFVGITALGVFLTVFSMEYPILWGFTKGYTIIATFTVSMWTWSISSKHRWLLRFVLGLIWSVIIVFISVITNTGIETTLKDLIVVFVTVFATQAGVGIAAVLWLFGKK